MAVALDPAGHAYTAGAQATFGMAVSVTAGGTNRALVLGIGTTANTAAPTSVTCDGTAMTLAGTAAINGNNKVYLYYIVAPNAGTPIVAATWAASVTFFVLSFALTGVHQTAPVGTYVSATGTSTTASTGAVTNTSGDMVVNAVNTSPVSNTKLGNKTNIFDYPSLGVQYDSTTNPTMTWGTLGSSAAWATCAIPFKSSSDSSGTVSSGTTVKIGEMLIAPARTAPSFTQQATPDTPVGAGQAESNAAMWEASGIFPKVICGTIDASGNVVWNDILTIPSVAPVGEIEIMSIPTVASPNGSMIVTTQDGIFIYPLPLTETHLTPYPTYPNSTASSTAYQTALVPATYFSTWDGGDSLYELVGIHIIAQGLTPDVDAVGIAARFDETNAWTPVRWGYNNETYFDLAPSDPHGNVSIFGNQLTLALSIYDAVPTDPVGPEVRTVVAWVEEKAVGKGTVPQVARTIPEVA